MKKVINIFVICMMLFPFNVYALDKENKEEKVEENKNETIEVEEKSLIVTLEDCVDGDTAKFRNSSNEVIKARFLAVDTPESVHPTKGVEPFGKEASEFTCNTLKNAKEIKIEYDLDSDEEDNYGRKLVWVFVDNSLLQELLISKGYAEVAYLYGDYKYTSLLQDTQVVAKVNKVGIWSDVKPVVDKEETKEKDKKKTKKDKKESFFDELLDGIMAKIFDFVDEILESILKSIEDML